MCLFIWWLYWGHRGELIRPRPVPKELQARRSVQSCDRAVRELWSPEEVLGSPRKTFKVARWGAAFPQGRGQV